MELALTITAKCNASCGHCSTSCSPHREESLSKEEIKRLMDQAARIDDGKALEFHLTGGEPFINLPLLLEVVAHAASLRAQEVSCCTNAYWAKSPEIAKNKLGALKAAGLTSIAVSVSRFHERFVPRQNVRYALQAARELNIVSELKGAVLVSDLKEDGLLASWKQELTADEINIRPIVPYLREGNVLPEAEYYREAGLPQVKCPDPIVCVEPNGAVMSCCGQASQTGFLAIGDARGDPLALIHERFVSSNKQRILREQGPIAFARGAIAAGLKHVLRTAYAGPCDLCLHIASDLQLRKVADDMAADLGSTRKGKMAPREKPIRDSFNSTTVRSFVRRLQMSDIALEQLKRILMKAITDLKFRDTLLENSGEAAGSLIGSDLNPETLELLAPILEDVARSSGASLSAADAEVWAIGLIVTNFTRRNNEDWRVGITDIPRKRKKKPFEVQVDNIPKKKTKSGLKAQLSESRQKALSGRQPRRPK